MAWNIGLNIFNDSPNKSLFKGYYMPSQVPQFRNTIVNNVDMVPALTDLTV